MRKLPSFIFGNAMLKSEGKTREEINRVARAIDDLDKKIEFLFWMSCKRDNDSMDETKKEYFLIFLKQMVLCVIYN